MLQSFVVDIDGAFVGVAVRLADGYKFISVGGRLEGMNGRVLPTLAELRRIARAAFLSGRLPGPATVQAMATPLR
jgi:hypothetical protein